MEPPGGRRISPFRVTKRSTKLCRLSKTTRSRVHVQTVGLNAETKRCRHRADGEECLLTFPFIGHVRFRVRTNRGLTAPYPSNYVWANDFQRRRRAQTLLIHLGAERLDFAPNSIHN